MDLNEVLQEKWRAWRPTAPAAAGATRGGVTLRWPQAGPFLFLSARFLYTLERRDKLPPWVLVYSGGKTEKTIENLAPRHPHTFRLQVLLRPSDAQSLGEQALCHYGDETAVLRAMAEWDTDAELDSDGSAGRTNAASAGADGGRVLQSLWSAETWASTDSDGTSAFCFCMAVRCGHTKQLQAMLAERPELIDCPAASGLTPLATAVQKGDLNTVRFLLSAGAQVDRKLGAGRTALHLAALAGNLPILNLLLENGADIAARDVNGLRVEHCAVDSGALGVLQRALDAGGELEARDSNGWTPLFRAVCQGASTQLVEALVSRGARVQLVDRAGLTLARAAALLRRHDGRRRGSLLRLLGADAACPAAPRDSAAPDAATC